jgi:hypothetical protein
LWVKFALFGEILGGNVVYITVNRLDAVFSQQLARFGIILG